METRERILKGSKELFFKFGLKSVTMDDIARHLGMSKKTIYQEFTDKDEIVEALISVELKSNQCQFEHLTEQSKDAVQELFMMMKHMGIMFSQINPNLFYDLQKYHSKAWKSFSDFKESFIVNQVENNLERGIAEGLYRPSLEIKILAKLRIEEVTMGMNPAIFSPEKYNFTKVQLALLDHFVYGILTLKGHKLINKYNQVKDEE